MSKRTTVARQGAANVANRVATGLPSIVEQRAQNISADVDTLLTAPRPKAKLLAPSSWFKDSETSLVTNERLRVIRAECEFRNRQLILRNEAVERTLVATYEGLIQSQGTRVKAAVVNDVLGELERMQKTMNQKSFDFAVELKPLLHDVAELGRDALMESIAEALLAKLKKSALDFFDLCEKEAEEFEHIALTKIAALQST